MEELLFFVGLLGGMLTLVCGVPAADNLLAPPFWEEKEVSRRRGLNFLLVAGLSCVISICSFKGSIYLEDKRMVGVEAHNLLHCVVRVEGAEYRPKRVDVSRGTGTMTLPNGEKINFLGGVIGSGCKN
jgi:hypothetical protein